MDHQQIAYEMFGDWCTMKTGRRRCVQRLQAMHWCDAVLTFARFAVLADDLAVGGLLDILNRRADRERNLPKATEAKS